MTKGEIFRRVSGYQGSQETKERMFERDKDDLRSLGIEIEVGGDDPLFEDEQGYRIKPESYQLPLSDFTSEELILITAALNYWKDSELEGEMSAALRRFNSGQYTDTSDDEVSLPQIRVDEAGLIQIADALSARQGISFRYTKRDSKVTELRRINPLGLSAWHGEWYVVGEDLDRDDIRAFKVARIVEPISLHGPIAAYEIPSDFDVRDYLIMYSKDDVKAVLNVRKDRALTLRSRATSLESIDEEWDRISVSFLNQENALHELSWFFDSIDVIHPESLRSEFASKIAEAVKKYV